MVPSKQFSVSVENYLKAIYHLGQEGDGGATPLKIAAQLSTSAPAVTKMMRYLGERELIDYTPYQPVRLTPTGEKVALEIIRHHRLLEAYLTQILGYSWEAVHDEAENLEHHISEEFEDTIARQLGDPEYDPHGDPIPTRDGKIPVSPKIPLASVDDGTHIIVRRVRDANAKLLSYLKDLSLVPGAKASIVGREPFEGSLIIEIEGRQERISREAAKNVFVEPLVESVNE